MVYPLFQLNNSKLIMFAKDFEKRDIDRLADVSNDVQSATYCADAEERAVSILVCHHPVKDGASCLGVVG